MKRFFCAQKRVELKDFFVFGLNPMECKTEVSEMNGFNYYSSSSDDKMRGVVSAKFITDRVMHKMIDGTGSGGDNKMFEFYFADGSMVRFVLNDVDADILYYAPTK